MMNLPSILLHQRQAQAAELVEAIQHEHMTSRVFNSSFCSYEKKMEKEKEEKIHIYVSS